MKRDLLKQQAVGQQRDRDRQSKHKSIFLTLIEDAESKVENIEKVSEEIDKEIEMSLQAQSKTVVTLAARLSKGAEVPNALPSAHNVARLKDDVADIKADLETTKKEIGNSRDRGRYRDDLHDLKADLKAAGKRIDNLNREAVMPDELRRKLHGLATKDELRGLVTKDDVREVISKAESRRLTTDEVSKEITEALMPTEEKLASLTLEDASLSKKITDLEGFEKRTYDMVEEEFREQSSRFRRLDSLLSESRLERSRLDLDIQEQRKDVAALKVDLEARNKLLTDLSTCDKIVIKHSDQISLLQRGYENLDKVIRQNQDLQTASKLESPQVSTTSVKADTKLVEEVKLMQSDLDALKAEQEEFKPIRNDLDTLRADQEKVELIRTDLDSLINEEKQKDASVAQEFDVISTDLKTQRDELARLQAELRLVKQAQASRTVSNHPPTPPFASVATSPREPDHQRLQDVETRLRLLTQTTQTLELFVTSQQQKFDRLTSDHLVQSMVHQMQQMYPQHPGNVTAWQARVDSYLTGSLAVRLDTIDSKIVGQTTARLGAQEKLQEVTKYGAETRKKCASSITSMKQDIESLKGYGNRIDGLVERLTFIEATYTKAIADIEKSHVDLVRNVTHSQRRSDSTALSRNSKSAEPRTTISREITHDSDSSDKPLSARRDRGDGRPSDVSHKRRAIESDGESEDGVGESRPPNAKKVPKRRNVSGNPFA